MKKLKINVKRIKFNIYAKIILLEIIVLCIMRFFVPILLNYPPMSEEKVFQSQIEPLSHTAQIHITWYNGNNCLYFMFEHILL